MSIVRVGLGETKGNFAEGYEAIFGKKDKDKKPQEAAAQGPPKPEDGPSEVHDPKAETN